MSALTVFEILEDVLTLRAVTYSGCALLVWDYLLTLDDEITYIWKSPSSIVKYLFIGNRYVNLLSQIFSVSQMAGALQLQSTTACLAFSWSIAISKVWSYGSVHLLVLLRVWILYGRTRTITIILVVAFTLYLCASFALLTYMIDGMYFSDGTCQEEGAPFSWLIWTVDFLLEVCLCGLTIFVLRRQKLTSEFSRISPLVRSLWIHAIIFLLANILDDLSNIITWIVLLKTPFFNVANSITIALVNITGQRLAINLKCLRIQKDASTTEVGREVELQLAAFDSSPAMHRVLHAVDPVEIPEIHTSRLHVFPFPRVTISDHQSSSATM